MHFPRTQCTTHPPHTSPPAAPLVVTRAHGTRAAPVTIPGCVFAGVVTETNECKTVSVGDQVLGFAPISKSGCCAEQVCVDEFVLSPLACSAEETVVANLTSALIAFSGLFTRFNVQKDESLLVIAAATVCAVVAGLGARIFSYCAARKDHFISVLPSSSPHSLPSILSPHFLSHISILSSHPLIHFTSILPPHHFIHTHPSYHLIFSHTYPSCLLIPSFTSHPSCLLIMHRAYQVHSCIHRIPHGVLWLHIHLCLAPHTALLTDVFHAQRAGCIAVQLGCALHMSVLAAVRSAEEKRFIEELNGKDGMSVWGVGGGDMGFVLCPSWVTHTAGVTRTFAPVCTTHRRSDTNIRTSLHHTPQE